MEREKFVAVYLSETERKELENKAREAGLRLSSYIRMLIKTALKLEGEM
ncbi:MAG: hypothetical protein QXW01_00265 [Candidatus Aenigmatarchaeota archaeon]